VGDVVPEIKIVMESSDDDWKFACIGWVIKELPREIVKELEPVKTNSFSAKFNRKKQ